MHSSLGQFLCSRKTDQGHPNETCFLEMVKIQYKQYFSNKNNHLNLSNICPSFASQLAKMLPQIPLILSMCHYWYVLKWFYVQMAIIWKCYIWIGKKHCGANWMLLWWKCLLFQVLCNFFCFICYLFILQIKIKD